jgi:erythromycin esterase-like protein
MLRTRTRRVTESPASLVAQVAEPFSDADSSLDPLLELIGEARVVCIGEASHGTHEFYAARAALTRRLIAERDFTAVCIEGDWPDAQRVDRWVRGDDTDTSAEGALEGFRRFPTWMWRNTVVRDFAAWLRDHNARKAATQRAGFYGLDLYSMFGSIAAVIHYLDAVDPEAAGRARFRYSCFDHFEQDAQAYGYAAAAASVEACEDDAVRQLVELRAQALRYAADGQRARDDFFSAERNATLVRNAEHYYRAMFRGRVSSWNLRDRHMAETLDAIEAHLRETGRSAKLVVWAHNSHLGDARYTDMGRQGELNLGQLARERFGDDACLIGFSTHTGTVTAAHDWDEPGKRRRVRPSLPDSYERVFHEVSERRGEAGFLLRLRDETEATKALSEPRLQRAIGVIYRPESERMSHYYHVDLPRQFDAIIHLDETTALQPLDRDEHWDAEPPETFPSAL